VDKRPYLEKNTHIKSAQFLSCALDLESGSLANLADVSDSINGAFPLFSYGERHIDEFLERYPFDRDGVKEQWEMFDRLSGNVMEFLRERFPECGERNHSIYCELQMCQLRDKIEANERKYECYRSIKARYTALAPGRK
jgi:hypothetical protein